MAKRATIGHNSGNVVRMDIAKNEKLADQFCKDAFADLDAKNIKEGTMTQRMAASLRYHHSVMSAVPAMSAYLTSEEAAKTLSDAMRGHFLPDVPKNTGAKDSKGNATQTPADKDARDRYNKRNTLITRGLELAAILDKCKVPLGSFNPKLGMWQVNAQLMCDDGFEPIIPRSQRSKVKLVFLDNKFFGIIAKKGEGTKNVQSGVAALKRCQMPKPVTSTTTATGQGATGNAAAGSASSTTTPASVPQDRNGRTDMLSLGRQVSAEVNTIAAEHKGVPHMDSFDPAFVEWANKFCDRWLTLAKHPLWKEPSKPATTEQPAPVEQAKAVNQ